MKSNKTIPFITHSVVHGNVNPLLEGLEAYYKLDEYTGIRHDSTGRYDLSDIGGYLTYSIGKLGNGVDVNINGGGLTADKNYGGILSNGFTICGWVNLHVASGVNGIVNAGFTNRSWFLLQRDGDTWQFGIVDSVSGTSIASKTIESVVDTWYFFAGRYNPATKKAEININDSEKAVSSTALENSPSTTYRLIVIGNKSGDEAYGVIDSVGFWTRYLTDDEVITLYNSGNGLEYPFTSEATSIEPTEAYAGPAWYVAP